MRSIPKVKYNTQVEETGYSNWMKGLNTLVSNTQIRADELSDALDIQLIEDGKIQCPRDGQDYYGSESGTKVVGLFPFYLSSGTNELVRMSGTTLQKYNAGNWANISGASYTSNTDAQAVMAYDRLYITNGVDKLTYYDGTDITTFTEISAPNAPTVTRTGTAGTYTFSYKYTSVTAVGETTPSAAGSTTANVATLDTSTYMTVATTAVTNAIGYNVYGRKDGAWYFITYLEGNGSVSYVDKGQTTPSEAFAPPEGNSTGGVTGKYITLYKDTLFVAGDPSNPSRLYYSGGGDKIHDFTIGNGGGFIDISKNDGQEITGLRVFKDSILVFKNKSIYKFQFTIDGLPSVEQVTDAVGAIAPRSIVAVENDIFFYAGSRGVFTLGNEAGFAFDVLRTNELSAKVRSIVQTIEPSREANVSAVYSTVGNKNLVIFSYTPAGSTTNSRALVYDRERLAWYPWTNVTANCFSVYRDGDGEEHVLYGCDSSGYVKELLTGDDDFGSAIEGSFSLKSEDFKQPARYKKLKRMDWIFREPTGTVEIDVVKDGVTTELTVPITTVTPTINWGYYVWGEFLYGESYGQGSITSQDDNILKTSKNPDIERGRSFMYRFRNVGSGKFVLLYAGMKAKMKSENYRDAEDIVEI